PLTHPARLPPRPTPLPYTTLFRSRRMLRACVLAATMLAASTAHAYEFWLRTQSIGQAYQLRDYRLIGPDLFLGRRRFTQTLALRSEEHTSELQSLAYIVCRLWLEK